MDREPRSLYPEDPIPEIYISPMSVLIYSIIFAIVFFGIGSVFRHYVLFGV